MRNKLAPTRMADFSSAEIYLQDFHRRHSGTTSATFAKIPARSDGVEYASSYAALTEDVPRIDVPLTVVDLACGDGYLLGLLARRQQNQLHLIGIDMSRSELDLARASVSSDVLLLNERCQSLSLQSGSVDCAISHMALMLMDDLEQVVRELRRVLRPVSGRFAAVVGRTFLLGKVNDLFLSVFKPIAKEDLLPMPFGDRRTRSEAGWKELLSGGFENIQFEDLNLSWEPTPNELDAKRPSG